MPPPVANRPAAKNAPAAPKPAANQKKSFQDFLKGLESEVPEQGADQARFCSKSYDEFSHLINKSVRDVLLELDASGAEIADVELKNGDLVPSFVIDTANGSLVFKLSKSIFTMLEEGTLTPSFLLADCKMGEAWSKVDENFNPTEDAVRIILLTKPGNGMVNVVRKGLPSNE